MAYLDKAEIYENMRLEYNSKSQKTSDVNFYVNRFNILIADIENLEVPDENWETGKTIKADLLKATTEDRNVVKGLDKMKNEGLNTEDKELETGIFNLFDLMQKGMVKDKSNKILQLIKDERRRIDIED